MIFKILLRNSIVEWCLDGMINSIFRNFKIVNDTTILRVKEIKPGMFFSRISDDIDTYFDCKIASVETYYDGNLKRIKMWFSFTRKEEYGCRIKMNHNHTWWDISFDDPWHKFIP